MNSFAVYEKIQQHLESKLPFVVYRKPGEKTIQVFLQQDDVLHEALDYNETGFVFAPFDHSCTAVLFPLSTCNFIENIVFEQNVFSKSDTIDNDFQINVNQDFKNNHIDLVQKGRQAVLNNLFSKVVLSRKEEITFLKTIDKLGLLTRLLKKYANAFVYLWCHPKIGTWAGATPETLLNVEGSKIQTMALAGTIPFENNVQVEWQEKEKGEQQIVVDFIKDRLSKVSDNMMISNTYTHKAGALLHLRTDISASLKPPHTISDLIHTLHPTPAVCGLPLQNAKDFILQYEGYQRKYYTGFLGELNMGRQEQLVSNLFVNLRCMELKDHKAILYIGGGITKDSDPEKEWEETVRKTSTMSSVLC